MVALAGASLSAQAIVNGVPVTDARFKREFPWAVALVGRGPEGGVCTGQQIAPAWVLTAAHCASAGVDIRSGHADRNLADQVTVAEAIQHPQYDAKSGEFDVGLLRLSKPVQAVSVAIAPAKDVATLLRSGAYGVIAGWGKRIAGGAFATRLVASDVVLTSLQNDRSRFVFHDGASGPCGGDSGGPLLLQKPDKTFVLVGIASRVVGDLCAQGGGVSLYVRVAAVRDFIDRHVPELAGR